MQFNVTATDETALSNIIASTNMSGTWSNQTPFVVSGTSYTYQYNLTNNRTRGTYVCARFYANDTAGNMNNSADTCFTVSNTVPTISTQNTFTNASAGHSFTVYANATDVDGAADMNFSNISTSSGACVLLSNSTNSYYK